MIFNNVFQQFQKYEDVYYLDYYHPYRVKGEYNPSFNDFSRFILNLKENKSKDIQYFFVQINTYLKKENAVICVVPSSNCTNIDTGIRRLAEKLAVTNNRVDGTSCLLRNESIPKASHGGSRSILAHLASIEVINNEIIKDREVILLDDVCTSGSSLKACEKLLINAGASKVYKVVLGLTYREGR